jgi:hypothetical protein
VIKVLSALPNVSRIDPLMSRMFDNIGKLINRVSELKPTPPPAKEKDRFAVKQGFTGRRRSSFQRVVTIKEMRKARIAVTEAPMDETGTSAMGFIYSIESFEGESVLLEKPVKITTRVDKWLAELDSQLRETLWKNSIEILKRTEIFDVIPHIGIAPFQVCYLSQCLVLTRQIDSFVDDPKESVAREIEKYLHRTIESLIGRQVKSQQTQSIRNGAESI